MTKSLKIHRLIIPLLMILISSNPVNAYLCREDTLFSRIEQAILVKEPKWSLKKRFISSNSQVAIYRWDSGKRSVYAFVYVLESSQQASKEFQQFSEVQKADGLDMKVLSARIPELGDENYSYQDRRDVRNKGVVVRVGTVIIRLSALSFEEAKLFATHLVNAIGAAEQTLGADSPVSDLYS